MRKLITQQRTARIATVVKKNQSGLTLIELIIALLIVGISLATIGTLLVNGFKLVEVNENFGRDLRAAESCYETILALHEGNAWQLAEDGQQAPWDQCGPCGEPDAGPCPLDQWTTITVGDNTAKNWVNDPAQADHFKDACEIPQIDSSTGNFQCRGVTLDGGPATQFRIPIRGSNNLELVIPIEEP